MKKLERFDLMHRNMMGLTMTIQMITRKSALNGGDGKRVRVRIASSGKILDTASQAKPCVLLRGQYSITDNLCTWEGTVDIVLSSYCSGVWL